MTGVSSLAGEVPATGKTADIGLLLLSRILLRAVDFPAGGRGQINSRLRWLPTLNGGTPPGTVAMTGVEIATAAIPLIGHLR